MDSIRLLLIEDDEDDYLITRDLLSDVRNQRYKLDWVSNPTVAREALSRNEHDVCLLDYELGAEDGVSLLKEAPILGFKGPIIMLTGQDDEYLDEKAQKAGAVDYLIKSHLNAPWLARAIRYAVSRQEMELARIDRMRAEAENRSKSEFLARLSHELRTPMTAILGYTDLIANQTTDHSVLENLQIIKRNSNHLLSLLNDVLDLSKIEAGKLEIEPHRLPLQPFLDDIVGLMRVYARDKGIELFMAIEKDIPSHVMIDSVRLRQILLNLISNAIKYTERGHVRITTSYCKSNSVLTFSIEDTGIGINKDQFDRLFKPFSQLSQVATNAAKGTGLGLAISQQLASLLGGSISVQSEAGKGSTFSVALALESIDNCVPGEPGFDPSYLDPTPKQYTLDGRILVVDDVPDIRNLIGQIISGTGCHVSYAADGEEAVRAFHSAQATEPYDLIVMDLQMPRLNGLEATRKIREHNNQIPILALTAATMRGEKERCLDAGVTDYLSKPVDAGALIATISTYLPSKHTQTAQKQRILLVEDNRDVLDITITLLENLGYEAYPAENGQQAMDQFVALSPELTLIDIHLPDIDGFTLARRLRATQTRECMLVALTGEEISAQVLAESELDGYQLKPISMEKLSSLTARYLRS